MPDGWLALYGDRDVTESLAQRQEGVIRMPLVGRHSLPLGTGGYCELRSAF